MSEASPEATPVVPLSSSPAPTTGTAAERAGGASPRFGAHIPALDGLRGLAIVVVLLNHFTAATPEPTSDWPRLLWRVLKSGWIGVDLFFVLSGFLITGILLDAKGGAHFFRNFYLRRTLRIFPLYYGVLVLVFLVIPRFHVSAADTAILAQYGQWWYWLYLTNVLAAMHHFSAIPFDAGHLWSLAVEEQFYLFWPVVVYAFAPRALKRVCVAIIVIAFGLRVGITLADDRAYAVYSDAKYSLLPTRADTLAMGALIAILIRESGGLQRLASRAWSVMAMAALPLAMLFVWERGLNAIGATMQTVGFTALAVFFSALLVATVASPSTSFLSRLFSNRWMMLFGRYSYALYLFHAFINPPLWRAVSPYLLTAPGEMTWLARAAYIALAGGISLVLAILSWNLFERHFLKLKDRFPYERHERVTLLPAP